MPAYRFKYTNELIELYYEEPSNKWTIGYVLEDPESKEIFVYHESIAIDGVEDLYREHNLEYDRYRAYDNLAHAVFYIPTHIAVSYQGFIQQETCCNPATMQVSYKTTDIPENLSNSLIHEYSNWYPVNEHILLVMARNDAHYWLENREKFVFKEEQAKLLNELNIDKLVYDFFAKGIESGISVSDLFERIYKNLTKD